VPPVPCRQTRVCCPRPAAPFNPRSEGGLQFVGDLVGHEGSIRELHFCLPDQPQLLHSCAADGSVRGWDTRSGQQVER
jgi:WD40 repeat protein